MQLDAMEANVYMSERDNVMKRLSHNEPVEGERLHYLDWLRVLAVLGVFYAHAVDIFDMYYWHLRNAEQNASLIVLTVFGTEWGMALFFFLAGAGAWFALESRTGGQFLGERFKRLIIPCIVGIVLLSPPQAYLIDSSQSLFRGNFLQFYPTFFTSVHLSFDPQWIGAYGFHLWFLAFLFIVSLLALPVLLLLKRDRGSHFIAKLAAMCNKPGGLFVFVLPIALVQIALSIPFPGYQNWADFFLWLFIFVYGFILFADPHFKSAIKKQWKLTLFVGITSLLIMLVAYRTGVLSSWDNSSSYSAGYVMYQLLRSTFTWSWMLIVLSFGMHFLNVSNIVIDYCNEAILPFYVLHYPVIVVIAFFTLSWNINMGMEFLIDTTIALIATLVLYDLCIRRIKVVRWLFGMKPLHTHHKSAYKAVPLLTSSSGPPLDL